MLPPPLLLLLLLMLVTRSQSGRPGDIGDDDNEDEDVDDGGGLRGVCFFSVPFPNVQNLTSAFCEILPKNLLKDSPCRSCKVFGKLKNSNANPQILLKK